MAEERKRTRRIAGVINARLPEVGLNRIDDPRSARGVRWKLEPVLTAPLVGMAAGLKSFAETEDLTAEMSLTMRRKLGIRRRIPDTTMRNTIVKMNPEEL